VLQGTTRHRPYCGDPEKRREISASGAHNHTALQQRLAWQGPEIIDSCGSAPDVLYAGPPDLREGDKGDRQPDLGITIRPPKGSRCAPQHLVLCGTYVQCIKE
jgi:hypothetical protein